MKERVFNLLADSLGYPSPETLSSLSELKEQVSQEFHSGDDRISLDNLISYYTDHSLPEIEESYTRTFDLYAVCPLEVGYTLFGEDYKRGEFLVRVSELHEQYKPQLNKSELADYLPNLLRLLPKMEESELKKDFIEQIILPALSRMLENFSKKKVVNPFSIPLAMTRDILNENYNMNPSVLEAGYE